MSLESHKHRLGWIGLGRMGYAMAERLAMAKSDIRGYNRTSSIVAIGFAPAISHDGTRKGISGLKGAPTISSRAPGIGSARSRSRAQCFSMDSLPKSRWSGCLMR